MFNSTETDLHHVGLPPVHDAEGAGTMALYLCSSIIQPIMTSEKSSVDTASQGQQPVALQGGVAALVTYWFRKLPLYLIITGGSAWFSWFTLGKISLAGAPSPEQVWVFWTLCAVVYVLVAMVSSVLILFHRHVPHRCLWQFVIRLMVGISLFPVVCVLFLNRSKL